MNLGEILDRTFQIYRSRFLVFAGIAALPALAMLGLHMVEAPWLHGPSTIYLSRRGVTLWNFVVSLGIYHVASFLGLLVFPAQVHLASTASLGERSSFSTALRFSAARWRSYLWIAVLKLFAVLVIPEILVVMLFAGEFFIAVLAGSLNNPRVAGGGLAVLVIALPAIVGCVLFLWLGSCLSLVVPASALEEVGALKALRRSWLLSKGSRARIMTTWIMISVFAGVSGYGLRLICRWMFLSLIQGHLFGVKSQHLYLPTTHLLSAMISTLIGPIYPIAVTLFYYDQRIRHEGYDIERMMDAAGMNAPGPSLAGDSPIASIAEEESEA
jgi:hypothetical protein